ncbi:MAG: DUF6268 family outer membrane beta-barrel protein [Planctomycetota bacterium]
MTARIPLRFSLMLLTAAVMWQTGAVAVRAAERAKPPVVEDRDEATLRDLFAPERAPQPLRIARPFDTGPQMDRRQGYPPPVDALQSASRGTPPGPQPFRIPPPAPELFQGQPFSDAYEYDSFEGDVPDQLHVPKWFPYSSLWPFSNSQATWVAGQGNTLGFVELERRFLFTNPFNLPLRVIPGFMTRLVSGPDTTDLPPRLGEYSVEVASTYQLGQVWSLDVGIRPGLNGDFQYISSETFRLQGHAVAARQLSPTTQGVVGFVYLDREDIPALPVVGWIWQPNPMVKWELVFPRPRLAIAAGPSPDESGWAYVKGELGGNSWTIERDNGARDVATYRDLRVIVGYETPCTSRIGAQFETGWVFARKLMYENGDPDFTPRDTFLIRAGLSF